MFYSFKLIYKILLPIIVSFIVENTTTIKKTIISASQLEQIMDICEKLKLLKNKKETVVELKSTGRKNSSTLLTDVGMI